MKASDQYLKIVEWSEKDRCYVGTCPGLMEGGVHGPNEAKVYQELCQVVDEWIEIYQNDGDPLPAATAQKEYSGKFVLRIGKELHKALAIASIKNNESLNNYCAQTLKSRLYASQRPLSKSQAPKHRRKTLAKSESTTSSRSPMKKRSY